MNTLVSQPTLPLAPSLPVNDDPFHDPVVLGIGIAFIVVAILILALTGLFLWGNLYHAPSWSSHAFPPAVTH